MSHNAVDTQQAVDPVSGDKVTAIQLVENIAIEMLQMKAVVTQLMILQEFFFMRLQECPSLVGVDGKHLFMAIEEEYQKFHSERMKEMAEASRAGSPANPASMADFGD